MSKLIKYKFSDLYTMSSGISSKPEQAGHGYAFASFTTIFNNYFLPNSLPDLMNSTEKDQQMYSIKKGDVFLTRTSETLDELGMSCVALHDYPRATYSGFVKRLRPIKPELVNEKYIGFYLRSKFFRKVMNSNAIMTIRASLNEEIFSYLTLHLPDIKTQSKIAEFLFLLNSKIETNILINNELLSMTKAIYDYWFVQFEFPDNNNKPYKHNGGKMAWNDVIKREVPIGWELKNLSTVVSWISGAQPSKSTFKYEEQEGYVRFIQNRDYASNKYKTYIANGKNNKLCNEFDIMIDKYGDAGAVRFGLSGAYNVALSKIDVNINNGQEYVRNYLRSDSVLSYLKNACIASTRASLNSENLESLNILIPNENILQKFEIMNKDFIKQILINNKENQKLTELRDWLMPMLMNGQVKVN
jgi:type I restriction enzyme S subunit